MNLKSIIFFFLAVAFTSYTLYTMQVESFNPALNSITSIHWGKLMLLDLYLGFLVFGVLVFLVEKSVAKALVWTLPCMILGNSVSLIYLAVKFFKK